MNMQTNIRTRNNVSSSMAMIPSQRPLLLKQSTLKSVSPSTSFNMASTETGNANDL